MSDRQEFDEEDTEYKQLVVNVPKRTHGIAKKKLDHGGLTRVVREALSRVAHGERTTEKERVKDHLRELRDNRRELMNERSDLNNRLDKLEIEIERTENRLDVLRDREGEYDGALQLIEQNMEDGMQVFVGHAMVEQAAEMGDCGQEDVLDDLKERNPDYPESQFSEGLGGE